MLYGDNMRQYFWQNYFNSQSQTFIQQKTIKLFTTNLLCKSTDWFLYDGNIGR